MATARERHELYERLMQALGDDAADTMVGVLDQLATKEDLVLLATRAEMASEFAAVRGEMASMREDMASGFADVRGEMASMREDMALLRADLREDIAALVLSRRTIVLTVVATLAAIIAAVAGVAAVI